MQDQELQHALAQAFRNVCKFYKSGDREYSTFATPWRQGKAQPIIVVPRDEQEVVAILQAIGRVEAELKRGVIMYATSVGGPVTARQPAILINLGLLKTIKIDPEKSIVRVGPGATWRELQAALAHFHWFMPIAGTQGANSVIGDVLSGAPSWVMRKYGFPAQQATACRCVTASGEVIVASASREEHRPLLAGLKGAGCGLVIPTMMVLKLHYYARLFYGRLEFSREQASLSKCIAWMQKLPEDITTLLRITRDSIVVTYCSSLGETGTRQHLELLDKASRWRVGSVNKNTASDLDWPSENSYRSMFPDASVVTYLLGAVPDSILSQTATDGEVEIWHIAGAYQHGSRLTPSLVATEPLAHLKDATFAVAVLEALEGAQGGRVSFRDAVRDVGLFNLLRRNRKQWPGALPSQVIGARRLQELYGPKATEWLAQLKAAYDPDERLQSGLAYAPTTRAFLFF